MTPPDERPAEPGELCTCGRQAVTVFLTEKWGEVGWCGLSDGGRGGPKPCPFCRGTVDHATERCPRYCLRPQAEPEARP